VSTSGEVDGVPVLQAAALDKTYRRGSELVRALHSVSLSLRAGEVVGLAGPSGSGKTTLLNVLCGWERPDAGTIRFRGLDTPSPAELPWGLVAVVPQDLALFEELPIGENVTFPLRLLRADPADARRADELLVVLGLEELARRAPDEVSVGEQQRAALARAVVAGPAMLLADEPTGHQDEGWTKVVMRVIRAAAAGGTACLVATHDPEAAPYLDRSLTMRDGILVESPAGPELEAGHPAPPPR